MPQSHEDRLSSWKEIAVYLRCDVRTVRRWERKRGLPVHRLAGGGHATVFAFGSEIDAWLRGIEEKAGQNTVAQPAGPVGIGSWRTRELSGGEFPRPLGPILRQEAPALPGDRHEAHSAASQDVLRPPRPKLAGIILGLVVLVAGSVLWLRKGGLLIPTTRAEDEPTITSVLPTAIPPRPIQTIVIKGRGFGTHAPFTDEDTPYLAIRDQTADWAAGRVMPQNRDDVTLNMESWNDSQIVISRISGAYGSHNWKLNPGDEIEIAVWNPQTGAGPALYHLRVATSSTKE